MTFAAGWPPANHGRPPTKENRMSVPIAAERRMLTEAEFEAVARAHYPDIFGQPKEELIGVARRLREYRDKARHHPAPAARAAG
jgi:hypothetical protein